MTRSLLSLCLVCVVLAAEAAPPPMPLPALAVPRLTRPPVIDGVMAEGEWDRAAACSGFIPAYWAKYSGGYKPTGAIALYIQVIQKYSMVS